jgi:ferredoxin--NADP+ reductase
VSADPTNSRAAGSAAEPAAGSAAGSPTGQSAGRLAVAIVGAGPSGFYTAAALLKAFDRVEIDIIEVLPTPFGLIRGGVAPDHQSTKRVDRAFARTARDPRVRFHGNVELGRDLALAELREAYDAVVLAVGMARDRDVAIPGAGLAGVFGAAAFVGWYNGHPDFRDLDPDLNTAVACVIGHGNVAIDVARVLVKTAEEMAASDLTDHAARAIQAAPQKAPQKAPLRDVYLIGRRGPVQAKFTNKELTEMGALADSAAVVDPALLPDEVVGPMPERDRRQAEKNLATLKGFAARAPGAAPSAAPSAAPGAVPGAVPDAAPGAGSDVDPVAGSDMTKSKRVHFLFHAKPDAVLGETRCTALRLEKTRLEDGRAVGTGEFFEIPCGLVISAIGYRMAPIEGLALDSATGGIANRDGRVERGLYVAGWAGRAPSGVIGTNKADGDRVAKLIEADLTLDDGSGRGGSGGLMPGRAALERLLVERGLRRVGFADWERIDAAEVAAAPPGAPRRKLTRIADLLSVLDGDDDGAPVTGA